MNVYGSRLAVVISFPNHLQESVSGQDYSQVLSQGCQKVEFFGSESKRLAIYGYFAASEVNM